MIYDTKEFVLRVVEDMNEQYRAMTYSRFDIPVYPTNLGAYEQRMQQSKKYGITIPYTKFRQPIFVISKEYVTFPRAYFVGCFLWHVIVGEKIGWITSENDYNMKPLKYIPPQSEEEQTIL